MFNILKDFLEIRDMKDLLLAQKEKVENEVIIQITTNTLFIY